MIEFDFPDGKALQKRMLKLPEELERKIAKKSVRSAADRYARVVRRKVAVSGNDAVELKKSIKVVQPKGKFYKNFIRANVGIGGPKKDKPVAARQYAHVYEFGSTEKNIEGSFVFTDTFKEMTQEMLDIIADKIKMEIKNLGSR